MFRLLTLMLAFCALYGAGSANTSELKLVVPDDTYSLLGKGKSVQQQSAVAAEQARSLNSAAARNSISEEDSAESAEEPAPVPQAGYRRTGYIGTSSSAGGTGLSNSGSGISSSSSNTGALRSPSLIIGTASNGGSGNLPTIQHQILPAETIPLPITISTRPGLRTVIAPETITIQQPTVARIGEVVQNIPTAVSHQRQTVVHNHARVVTPIVAPAVRTITSQVLRAYHTPLIYAPQQIYARAGKSSN